MLCGGFIIPDPDKKYRPKPPSDIRANIPEEDQVQKKVADDPIDRAAEQICDDYCKFRELIKNEDILHNICEGCPLNILMTGGFKKC